MNFSLRLGLQRAAGMDKILAPIHEGRPRLATGKTRTHDRRLFMAPFARGLPQRTGGFLLVEK